MAQDATKISVGPATVTVDGVDVGHTIGGVEFNYEQEYHETKVDKYGNTVVERTLLGEKMWVKVPFAEFQLTQLKQAMPMATDATTKITMGKMAGEKLSDYAGTVVIHPTEMGADTSLDITLYKAAATTPLMIPFNADAERAFEVEFHAMVDETKTDGNYLGAIGDDA